MNNLKMRKIYNKKIDFFFDNQNIKSVQIRYR